MEHQSVSYGTDTGYNRMELCQTLGGCYDSCSVGSICSVAVDFVEHGFLFVEAVGLPT